MSSFENIVRPFQLPDNAPPKQYVTAKQQAVPPVILYFGRSGGGKTMSGSFSTSVQYYLGAYTVEDFRPYKSAVAAFQKTDQALSNTITKINNQFGPKPIA